MQHAFDTDALIDLRPIDTGAVTDQLPMVALSRSGLSVVTGIDGLIFTFRDGESCLPTVTFFQTLFPFRASAGRAGSSAPLQNRSCLEYQAAWKRGSR